MNKHCFVPYDYCVECERTECRFKDICRRHYSKTVICEIRGENEK